MFHECRARTTGKMKFPIVIIPNRNLESPTTLHGSVLSRVTVVASKPQLVLRSPGIVVRLDSLVVQANKDSSQRFTK